MLVSSPLSHTDYSTSLQSLLGQEPSGYLEAGCGPKYHKQEGEQQSQNRTNSFTNRNDPGLNILLSGLSREG